MINRYSRLIKFVIVGVVNTINYYLVYLLLLKVLHLGYLSSHLTGFLVSFIISYFLNCYVVYKVKPTLKKLIQFPLTQVVNMGIQTLLLFIFVDLLHFNNVYAPFPALVFTIPITYFVTTYILTKE
ncbi:GtrA family protein [Macrococcoides caseolyticum]|uniref:GtrA/DPMS transmembrane domain-containing protein n=2 Tax=Macrococcoides caseolyticum TaxID=69966 RepID=B9EBC3_MACCJ|nr:GtrA family protein [Macrococcus caseolyticus]MDI8731571.1 GtrA family protein [Salmonella enterica subsp. enterica serovar Cerro]MDJ1088590.1 GtrA family protein [Macrococcus caseolyticus]MDJ1091286.1 GtrA family protein [Macrococcus caseolyticus]MDJ1109819.1 GtrA family protein [Macrococcus caseolyticus]MDJ1153899.1 GtrA family protein [Macrococcus caseolyticus]